MKVYHVIRREFVENVRRKSFIISTLLVPVLMLGFFVVPLLFAMFTPDRAYRVAVVDQTDAVGAELATALTDTLATGARKYEVASTAAPGARYDAERTDRIAALQRGEFEIVIAIPSSVYDDGKVDYITREDRNFSILERFEDVLTDVVIKQRLAREGLDYDQVTSLTTGVELNLNQVTRAGDLREKDMMSEYGIVFVFTMILYMALMSWGMTISKSVVEEKGSRIIEVLLSALTPRDLMVGKLVGVGLAGLTQLLVWAAIGAVVSVYAATGMVAVLADFDLPPVVFAYFILYFVLGFLLYSSLFMTVGAMCSTDQDAQQLQGLITLPMIVPILSLMLLIQSPNSPLAVFLSLIPVFAPMMMLARIILLQPPAWQIILSIVLLLGSIYVTVTFAARVFRVGILMYGKRPSLREVMRWYRYAR